MKRRRNGWKKTALIGPMAAAIACTPPRAIVVDVPAPAPAQSQAKPPAIILGQLPVEQIIIPTRPATPLVTPVAPTSRISLTATNASVREVLPALAQAAGISLVMTPDVKGRVSVYLKDVSPLEALRAVINQAGLTVGEDTLPLPFGPAVFFQLPVNVNTASAPVLKARFGISDSTANWLVRARSW